MGDEIQLLKEAAAEIHSLRRRNDLMSARLEMFDSINAMLHTTIAHNSVGMSPDIVWAIEKIIHKSETP